MKILVVGAGSWGTALAMHCAKYHKEVSLWGRNVVKWLGHDSSVENIKYLPGFIFPDNLKVEPDLNKACMNATHVIIAVPSAAFREVLQELQTKGLDKAFFISATKGLDPLSNDFLSKVFTEIYSGEKRFSVLAGPCFAKEVAAQLPTAAILSSLDKKVARESQILLHHGNFRVYINTDIIGTQLGACLKNVLAIAAAISDGLGCGANARAALITRGLAEMVRLADAIGAKRNTLNGLAGLGDLVLTATDDQSRNRKFGLCLGKGMSVEQAYTEVGQVVEGARAVKSLMHLIKQYNLELPISTQVFFIIEQGLAPKEAVKNLLSRLPTEEIL